MALPSGLTPLPAGLTPVDNPMPRGLTALPKGLSPLGAQDGSGSPEVYDVDSGAPTPAQIKAGGIMAYPVPGNKIALIPTRDETGKQFDDPVDNYWKTGKSIGTFNTMQDAMAASKFWQDQSSESPTNQAVAPTVNATMMPSYGPTAQPTPPDIGAVRRGMNYLFGSDKSLGLGDLDLRAMAGNLVASGESTVSGIAGYMAKRFDDLSKVLGNTMPSLGIARLVAKEISPKLDNDAAAKKVLEHVSSYTGAMAQQARGWAPQGYQPGIVGKIEQMGAPLAASIANPIAGAAAFGMPMGNEAEEAAKASGASVPAQKLMGVAGSVAGGITGLFGTGSGAVGGVAPTTAERLASSGQAAGLGGAITAGMNALEKLIYNPDKKVLEGVSDNALMMGIVGFAHASGNPVTEEEATGLAKFAREDPEGFSKKYKSIVAPIIERASPQAPPERTPDMIRQEALVALRSGDVAKASALADELTQATVPKPVEPEPGPSGAPVQSTMPGAEAEVHKLVQAPETSPVEVTPDIHEAVSRGMAEGHKNASEWLASARDTMDPGDFAKLYKDIGGVKGANELWQNNERSSAMMDKPFTSRESGETFPLQTEVNGDQVTTVGNRKGIAPADRPSATVSINPDGSLHLDGIDNKGVAGTGNEMFRKTVLAALNNGGDESGVIHAEATPEAREMLSRYKGFKDDGRIVEVPTDSVLGNKQNPEKMKFASAGLNPFEAVRDAAEAAKRELGLPEGATDADLGREVMNRIGRLGSSVKETVVRIMSKIRGIGRDMAQALAEHFHQAVSGTREGQLGAIGKDIKPKARDFLTPEQIEAEKADRAKYKDLLQTLIPGDTPEAKAERAGMWKNYEAPWKRELPPEEAPAKPSLPYRPTTRTREGSVPDAINQFLDQTLRRAFPSAVDQAGARAGDISRYRESEAATAVFKANRNIRNALVKMSMAKPEIREMVADAIESPSGKYKINDPNLAKSVDFVKSQSRELGEELVKAGAINSYVENYLHHAFRESPEQIELAIKKKSPTGNLGYLIERHGPDTYAIAKELGLTPKNTNPFQTFFDDFVNKQKFLVANKTISDLMGEGLVTKDAQPGYVKLNDYLRNAVSKSKAGEAGEYYAPKSVADLLNNHLGEGFERNAGFRAIRAFNNSMNHVQLGLSFFHGMFIMRDMANTMLGSGITAMARGDFREGARQLALGASPIYGQKVMASSGSEMRSMMAGETPTTPEMQQVIHAYQLGGGHPELSPEYINDSLLKMRESWSKAKDVNLDAASRAYWGVKTVGEIPFSAVEAFAKPVMEHLVPNAKAGAFRELWRVERKRLPPDATDAQKAVVARKLVNDIDDRMGQLIYNNLHLPNAMKQAITLTIRAGGWDIGSLRAIYGAGIDFARAGKMVAQDAAAKVGAIKPETVEAIKAKREAQGVFGPKSYMTQRMGYGVASALSMAVTNGLITYVGNRIRNAKKGPGEKDTETKPTGMDYVFPRIGKDRYSVAGYEKEAVEQYRILKNVLLHHDPSAITDYISQKASPTVNLAKMWGSGYDWKGNRIGKLSALAQQYNPMVVKDMGSPELPTSSAAIGRLGGPNPIQNAGRFVGITPAPKKLTQTDAENKALDILHQDKTPLSEQAANHADFVNRMALYYKNGDMEVYNDAKNKGLLTPQDINRIKMKAREHDLLIGVVGSRSVSPEDALDIYKNYATPDEQKKLKPIMLKKKMMARRSTPPADMEQWRKDWSVVK